MDEGTAPRGIDIFAIDDEFLPGAEQGRLLGLIALPVSIERLEDDFSGVHGFCGLAVESDAVVIFSTISEIKGNR